MTYMFAPTSESRRDWHFSPRLSIPSDSLEHLATPDISPVTGPFDALRDQSILVLADIENLSYSAQNQLGHKFSYASLTERLIASAASCALHAFFSVIPDEAERRRIYFEARGWTVHNRAIEVVKSDLGMRKRANIDNQLLFKAGLLVSCSAATTVVLASGDGDLVCDLAQDLSSLTPRRRVVTLSLAGSTSQRLDARHNRYIDANIEVGLDCLRPLTTEVMSEFPHGHRQRYLKD